MSLEQQLQASIDLAKARKASLPVSLPGSCAECRRSAGLPDELYYTGVDLFVPLPAVLPIDETRPLSPMDRDARKMMAQGQAGLMRFFAGRWSRRLGRVVRPV